MQPEETEELEARLVLEAIFCQYGYDFRGYGAASMRRRLGAVLARTGIVDPTDVDVTVTPDVDGGITFVTIRARTAVSALALAGLPTLTVQGQTRVPRPA